MAGNVVSLVPPRPRDSQAGICTSRGTRRAGTGAASRSSIITCRELLVLEMQREGKMGDDGEYIPMARSFRVERLSFYAEMRRNT